MQSLRSRLLVLILLLCGAGAAAGALMVGLFNQSAAAQVGQASAEIGRACDAISAAYRFYSANWEGPTTSLKDTTLRAALTTVVQTALRDRVGIEGGLWQDEDASLAYSYPTYQGAQPKTDFPQAELSRIAAINAQAMASDRAVSASYAGSTEVLLLSACPVKGPIPQLTAWTMTRVVTFAGHAYRQLMAGLAVLLVTVIVAATFLIRITLIWSRHVASIESRLASTDVEHLPIIEATGEKELDQIVAALNVAGQRLAEAKRQTDELGRQVASGERLAAIGRVAAGMAHEIRNPIAAMRLKAENALLADEARKDTALAMILEQIERLDRLLKRLLSLTERDPPRFAPTDLEVFLKSCVDGHRELAVARGLRLKWKASLGQPRFDADQMRRALDNLILNAREAAPWGSEIEVLGEKMRDRLIFRVHDDGIGPPAVIRETLFEPFVTGRAEGTGLGLSVVREIANAHGGSASLIESSTGTTFEISVPWQ